MSEIPEDIAKTAKSLVFARAVAETEGVGVERLWEFVAGAMLAERERCYGEAISIRNPTPHDIASAILNSESAQKPHGNARGQITGDKGGGSFPAGGPQPAIRNPLPTENSK